MKDWLTTEMARNHERAALYTRLLRRAFGELKDLQVMIGHHLTIEYEGRLETEDEIPSADTMIFDHEIMGRAFGDRAKMIMMDLAISPANGGQRDARLELWLSKEEVDYVKRRV